MTAYHDYEPHLASAMGLRNWPSKEDVERIASRVASEAGLRLSDLTRLNGSRHVTHTRRAAWRAIIDETRCSIKGLAIVWGCDRRGIQRAMSCHGAVNR